MSRRIVVVAAVTGFLVVGVAGWIGGMPKPQPIAPIAAVDSGVVTPGGTVGDSGASDGSPAAAVNAATGESTPLSDSTAAPKFSSGQSKTDGVIDSAWLVSTSEATAIPPRVLQAYAAAAVETASADATCGLSWNTIAAIGDIESANGTHGGAHIDQNGELVGTILGPVLDGGAYTAVHDTDHGALDGNKTWDRAVGPMQFIPSTWEENGVDGSGDGKADPNDIDDASLTTAHYLCKAGGDMTTAPGWTAAIRAYNHDDSYLAEVRRQANLYAQEAPQQ